MLRLDLLNLIYKNGGHIGGCLSALDIIDTLYDGQSFNFDQDHFVLSAGHLAAALYVVLAKIGKIDKKLLDTYSCFGSPLQGHVSHRVPGVEYSSGSLGQGLSFATGLALGDSSHYSVCLTSDGEHQEGQIWEAATFANKYKLKNLINIISANGLQIDGKIEKIMPLGSLSEKYIQFGWNTITIDGHNQDEIKKAIELAKKSNQPTCIFAKTIMGKGISYMENNFQYHDVKSLSQDLYEQAVAELK